MLRPKPRPPATYADIEALPANMVGQIVLGVLHAHPRPAPPRGAAAGELEYEINGPFGRGRGGRGGCMFRPEPELTPGPHVVVPDIAGRKRERLTPFPSIACVETPPDWLCEVLSPATQAVDRTGKLTIDAAVGVKHCWYADTIAKMVAMFALINGEWQIASTYKDGDPVCAPPFETHTFALDVLLRPDADTPA